MSAVRIIRGVLALPFRGAGWIVLLLADGGYLAATGLGGVAAWIAGR